MVRKIGIGLTCVLLFFILIFTKVYFSSMQEFKTAENAFSQKDYPKAIQHYERAILWYVPVGGYVEPSAKRLWEIAETLESEESALALEAYRTLRSAFYATRSFYTPGQPWIDRANPRIARLMAGQTNYSEADRQKSLEQLTQEALVILERPMRPDPFWSFVVVLGFLGWATGVLLFIWRAFREGGTQVMLKQGIVWGTVIIVFYALWIIGMTRA